MVRVPGKFVSDTDTNSHSPCTTFVLRSQRLPKWSVAGIWTKKKRISPAYMVQKIIGLQMLTLEPWPRLKSVWHRLTLLKKNCSKRMGLYWNAEIPLGSLQKKLKKILFPIFFLANVFEVQSLSYSRIWPVWRKKVQKSHYCYNWSPVNGWLVWTGPLPSTW